MTGRRALVTGATRGIGKAIALALAGPGWDVAITGRTSGPVRVGTTRTPAEGGPSPAGSTRRRPGSGPRPAGGSSSCRRPARPPVACAGPCDRVIADWGGVDLLVNNAVDTGPGSMVPILDLPWLNWRPSWTPTWWRPLVLVQAVLPGMLERGGGIIVNVTSHTATADPPGPVGQGGWGLGYAASKAALHRFAPLLAVEHGCQGIRAFNVDPGYVETERQLVNAAALGLVGHYTGAPPSVPAAAVTWMADHPEEFDNGQTVRAQKLALTHDLHPDWRPARSTLGPAPRSNALGQLGAHRSGRIHGLALAVVDRPVADGGHPDAAEQLAGQVEGIGSGHGELRPPSRIAPHVRQQRRRLG